MKHAHHVKHLDRLVLVCVGVQIYPGIEFVNTLIKRQIWHSGDKQIIMCFENHSNRCKYIYMGHIYKFEAILWLQTCDE